MSIATIIVFLLAAALGYLTFRLWDSDNPPLYFIGLFAFILFMTGIGSCRENFRSRIENIAAQHAGHEALHAQIKADLEAAEPGDIIEMSSGERAFAIVHRSRGSIETRDMYSYAFVIKAFYVDNLVLDHAKVIKLGSPEYAATLVVEAEKRFKVMRQQRK